MIIRLRLRVTGRFHLRHDVGVYRVGRFAIVGFVWIGGLTWLGASARFGGSSLGRVDVVLVLDQQLQSLSWSGQNADGPGPTGPDRIGVTLSGQDFRDSVHRR